MITKELISQVAAELAQSRLEQAVINKLRKSNPQIHFSFCAADEVELLQPVYTSANFLIYLLDNSSHCIAVTTQLESASGLLIAEIE